jgi:sulfur-carrier protein
MASVRFYAAAREAAGVSETTVPAIDSGELVALLRERYGDPMARVLTTASLLVDGQHVSANVQVALGPDALVDVLPPFAGG